MTPITIPRLGWSMEEGIFGEWLKAPGEIVRAGEMVFLLEGEKAAHEIESFDSGVLCVPSDGPKSGETVKVGQVIGFLLAEGEVAPTSVGPRPDSPAQSELPAKTVVAAASQREPASSKGEPRVAGPAARRLARQLGVDLNVVPTPDPTGRVLCEDIEHAAASRTTRSTATVASPRAKRRASELGIDWRTLGGTGRDGRVRERDVIAQNGAGRPAVPVATELRPTVPGRHVPASKLRLTLAQRMVAGVHQAAPVTITTKVDASALVAYRNQLKTAAAATAGIVPSYNDLLIHLTAVTLREYPELNCCWFDNGIYQFDEINICVAVDTEHGLLAPVIRNADRLTLAQIATQTRELIERARSGRLTQNDLQGGTMTTTNLGSFGVDAFTPILNLPQAAILGIGRIVEEPVVRDGEVVAGHTLTLSLTFDHRVIDGAPAARWLQRVTQKILSLRR